MNQGYRLLLQIQFLLKSVGGEVKPGIQQQGGGIVVEYGKVLSGDVLVDIKRAYIFVQLFSDYVVSVLFGHQNVVQKGRFIDADVIQVGKARDLVSLLGSVRLKCSKNSAFH